MKDAEFGASPPPFTRWTRKMLTQWESLQIQWCGYFLARLFLWRIVSFVQQFCADLSTWRFERYRYSIWMYRMANGAHFSESWIRGRHPRCEDCTNCLPQQRGRLIGPSLSIKGGLYVIVRYWYWYIPIYLYGYGLQTQLSCFFSIQCRETTFRVVQVRTHMLEKKYRFFELQSRFLSSRYSRERATSNFRPFRCFRSSAAT
jgi:hypothetical protein